MSVSENMSASGRAQIDSLQILRAAAASSVLLFHYFLYLYLEFGLFGGNLFEVGAFGVDIFFVVSGFIICFAGRNEVSPIRFMLKRMSRIVPLYYLLTFCVFAAALVVPHLLYSTTANAENLVQSLLFIPYAKENGLVQPLLFLGWTLNYEMFFYLVFALCMLAGRQRIFAVIGVIIALVTYGKLAAPELVPVRFFTEGIMLNFVWGCVVYLVYERAPRLLKLARPLWPLAVAAMVVQNWYPAALPREYAFGLPSMLLVAGLLTTPIGKGPISRFFVKLGDASYSLYLIHPYILQPLFKIAIPVLGVNWLSISLSSLAAGAVIIGVSMLVFLWVERPSNEWLRARLLAFRRPAAP